MPSDQSRQALTSAFSAQFMQSISFHFIFVVVVVALDFFLNKNISEVFYQQI